MTREEFDAIVFLLANGWKGGLTADQEEAYWTLIGHCDKIEVVDSLRSLLRSGSPFVPTPAEIVQAMQPSMPTFEEVWPQIYQAMRRFDAWNGQESSQFVIEAVRERAGDHAAGWLASYGVGRLAQEPVDDPAYGGAILHRLGEDYRERSGSPDGRDRLAAITAGSNGNGLRRVDAAGLIGAGE